MLEHRNFLDQLSELDHPQNVERGGLRVAAVRDRGLLLLQVSRQDSSLDASLRAQLGIGAPEPLRASVGDNYALLWLAPGECLLELPKSETLTCAAALTGRFVLTLAAVTDVSDALASFDINGDRVAEVLMTGCSLDLHSEAFEPDRVARTVFAGIPTIVWKRAVHQFRCLSDRSHAGHLWNWFCEKPSSW